MQGIVNSPGKILFYGGYSVLLRGHVSLSIAVVDKEGNGVTSRYKRGEKRIISRQFGIDREPLVEDISSLSDKLIDVAYLMTEAYLKAKGKWKEDVTIELWNSPIFGDKDTKSGLGSSAAAVTSTIKALFEAQELSINFHKETIFKLSQMAYGAYATKIGSGFDLATASLGRTIIYKRYNPDEIILPQSYEKEELIKCLIASIDKPWGWIDIEEFEFPYNILFFNIETGKTHTISAVKAWKQWKVNNPERFEELMRMQNAVEEKAIEAIRRRDEKSIREYTHQAREVHRKMQNEIQKVVKDFDPIEPPPLTDLIDYAEKLPSVIAGRCPGAGGWDGVAFIVRDIDPDDVAKIEDYGRDLGLKLKMLEVKVL